MPANDVGDIVEDRKGNLWIGTLGGLAMLDPNREQMIIDRHVEGDSLSIAGDVVGRIHEDQSGAIWISTFNGLSRLLPGGPYRFKNYLNRPEDAYPLDGNEVSDILEDSLSNLWVATSGNGLIRLEQGRVSSRFVGPDDSSGTRSS